MTRIIRTCAGIGDGIFLIKKLVNAGEKFQIRLPNGQPQRGKQIWDLLPMLTENCQYIPGLSYKTLERYSIHNTFRYWREVNNTEFNLSMNRHLEHGHRIEEFFPDLATTHVLPWGLQPWEKDVKKDFPAKKGVAYIGIYASAYSTVRQWGFWDAAGWMRLIYPIHRERPKWKFVLIGAEWDNDIAGELIQMLERAEVPYINTVGKELGYVGNVMKKLDYGFYFTSGLPIFSETIKGASDLTMFFPPHLAEMMGTFCDLARKESGQLKECLYCNPEDIYQWWVKTYQGFEKIN